MHTAQYKKISEINRERDREKEELRKVKRKISKGQT